MATAQSTLRVVTPPPPPPEEVGGVVLSLSGPEARTLAFILGGVGGDGTLSPRGYADQIRVALEKVGISSDYSQSRKLYTGSIMFNDGTTDLVKNHE